MFGHISKHSEVRHNYSPKRRIFNSLPSEWSNSLLCLIYLLQNHWTTAHPPPKSNFFLGFCVSFGLVAATLVSCLASFFSPASKLVKSSLIEGSTE